MRTFLDSTDIVIFLVQAGFPDGLSSLFLQVELSVLPCIADEMTSPSVEEFVHPIVYWLLLHNIVVSNLGSVTNMLKLQEHALDIFFLQ
jgi:hypothetical protein